MAACAVRLAPWPAHLPLIGAARTAAPAAQAAVVLDFGHTFVKRARARYEGGTLAELRLLPPLPARYTEIAPGTEPTPEESRRLADFIVTTIAETWRAAHDDTGDVSSTVVASLASYLRDGQPLARQGGAYAYLLGLSDNLAGWLGEQRQRHHGTPPDHQLDPRWHGRRCCPGWRGACSGHHPRDGARRRLPARVRAEPRTLLPIHRDRRRARLTIPRLSSLAPPVSCLLSPRRYLP